MTILFNEINRMIIVWVKTCLSSKRWGEGLALDWGATPQRPPVPDTIQLRRKLTIAVPILDVPSVIGIQAASSTAPAEKCAVHKETPRLVGFRRIEQALTTSGRGKQTFRLSFRGSGAAAAVRGRQVQRLLAARADRGGSRDHRPRRSFSTHGFPRRHVFRAWRSFPSER